jgi:putative methionine-R-sulfoxide reductase with GAF domain
MLQVNLKRLVTKKSETAFAIIEIMRKSDPFIRVVDAQGNLLAGEADAVGADRHAVEFDGEVLGWVIGGKTAAQLAALLSHLVAKEAEKKSLANEVLGLYREINLLFNLSETLAASLELETVARLTLGEATSLIKATDGAVMLFDEERRELESVASMGSVAEMQTQFECIDGIVHAVARSGKAEIVEDVKSDPRYVECGGKVGSLVCAPLKAKQIVIGALLLVNATPVIYTAAELKLLNTVASQAGPAIESALVYEKTVREAKKREERLQRQIEQLKIELDEAKMTKRVAEITESDYFQRLREQADVLRETLDGAGEKSAQ